MKRKDIVRYKITGKIKAKQFSLLGMKNTFNGTKISMNGHLAD